jgi:hypothetical protein
MKDQFNSLLDEFICLKGKTEEQIFDGTFQLFAENERSKILDKLTNLKNQIQMLLNRLKIGIAAGVLSLSLITFTATKINAQSSPVNAASLASSLSDNTPSGPLTTAGVLLYEQFDYVSGNGAPAQNFESSFDIYDCEGADDFVVPEGRTWAVDEIVITSSYSSLPDPFNVTVRFYDDDSGSPGTLIEEFVGFDINSSTFMSSGIIPLPSTVLLSEGTKWVSFQANLNFTPYGQIFWSNRTEQTGNPSHWINPGNGFSSGATDWTPVPVAGVGGGNPDFLFAIYGIDSPATVPFPIIGSIFAFLGIGIASFFGIRRKRKKLL